MADPKRLPEVLQFVGYTHDAGGIMAVLRALAAERQFVCRLGVAAGFVATRPPAGDPIGFAPIAAETIDVRSFWRARIIARQVQTWLSAGDARVYHGHSRAGLLVALWLARGGQRRAVASVHAYGRQRWFYRWAARQLGDRLFWLSPAMKRHYGLADASWSRCIPGCVTPRTRLPRPARTGSGLRLGGIGALAPVKRWERVLEALASLPAAARDQVVFRHIGGTPAEPKLQRYAAALRARTQQLGLGNIVQWLGEAPSADEFLSEIDCLVVASEVEAFSVALLESLRAGVPVLAPDAGGAVDVLTAGKTGWFFRHRDPADLGRVMTRLVEDDAAARMPIPPDAILRFTSPVVAREWWAVYDWLLAT